MNATAAGDPGLPAEAEGVGCARSSFQGSVGFIPPEEFVAFPVEATTASLPHIELETPFDAHSFPCRCC